MKLTNTEILEKAFEITRRNNPFIADQMHLTRLTRDFFEEVLQIYLLEDNGGKKPTIAKPKKSSKRLKKQYLYFLMGKYLENNKTDCDPTGRGIYYKINACEFTKFINKNASFLKLKNLECFMQSTSIENPTDTYELIIKFKNNSVSQYIPVVFQPFK